MVASGRRMKVFVNDATSPTLQVGRLEVDAMKGSLRLQGPRTFANMVIAPDAVDGLSPEPAGELLEGDRGLVRNWHLSAFSALPNGKDPAYKDLPSTSQEWRTISTERNGLVNLSRRVWPASARVEPSRSMAEDDHDFRQEADEESGYWIDARTVGIRERETGVYGQNLFEVEGARKFPDARCSLENGAFTLPLEAGDNEVAVAIANNFFGWGLKLRLADPEGVRLAAK